MNDRVPQDIVEKLCEQLSGKMLSGNQKVELEKQTKVFYTVKQSLEKDIGGACGVLSRLYSLITEIRKQESTKGDTKDTLILAFLYAALSQMHKSIEQNLNQQNDLIGQLHVEHIETNHYLSQILKELKSNKVIVSK